MPKISIPSIIFCVLIILGLLCYVLPQVDTPALAWRMGGYDLAEWVSIHPAVRADAGMTGALLLRLPLVVFTLLTAWLAALQRGWRRVLLSLFALLFVTAQLPPFEFFTSATNDNNYRQQFFLALFSLLASAALFTPLPFRLRQGLVVLGGLVGAGALVAGVAQAQGYLQSFQIPASISVYGLLGAGIFLLCAAGTLFAHRSVESNRAA